jgi:hypothetical protein
MSMALEVRRWGDNLSQVDPGSEANVLREVRNFMDDGLTKYYGLGNLNRPGMYPDAGTVSSYVDNPQTDPGEAAYVRSHVLSYAGVYTHYPPGPEYLVYATAQMLGLEPVWRLRLVPIAVGLGATLFLALSICCRFGVIPAWLATFALVLNPSIMSGFSGLHNQGYAVAFTMIEIGLTFCASSNLVWFFGLGFFQGWLSFDQFFIVTLIPLSMEAVMPDIEANYRSRWSVGIARTIAVGFGCSVAHTLHFMQIWAYLGTFSSAVGDLAGAAAFRAGIETKSSALDRVVQLMFNVFQYFVGPLPFDLAAMTLIPYELGRWPSFRLFGMTLGPWWVLITATLIVAENVKPDMNFSMTRTRWYRVTLVGGIISSMWLIVMANHAGYHERFIFRHLFFAYMLAVIFIGAAFAGERDALRSQENTTDRSRA